jgi:3-phenylpropionate/trans-cinnamate dioxygenase ferredoxin subunit/anthranilate 1,2-dioxygenase ferredoxin subunit
MVLNLIMVAVYGVDLGLRSSVLDAVKTPLPPLILSLIGIGLLSVSGYLGGRLVYDDGIAVGRHRRRTDTPEETLRFSTGDFQEGAIGETIFVPIAAPDKIRDRETLRVEIDGQIIVVAKFEGGFFAVQEFCTHRFGPLSEGVVKDGNIECPWHRSCFELRTGKVAKGPAKVDLKTFPVEIREGKICIAVPRSTK